MTMPIASTATTISTISIAAPAATTDTGQQYEGFIGWILGLIETLGEIGVGIAVFAETFIPPIPSEAILPVAGFLAFDGRMNPILAWAMATVGALVGGWAWYAIGAALGRDRTRRLIERVPLMDGEDFDKAEKFFQKWGVVAVLVGRCIPLVRSFVSIPAGIERMNLLKFSAYTALGSGVWNAIWIGLGYAFGPAIRPALENWSGLLSKVVIMVIALLVGWFVIARLRKRAEAKASQT